MTRRVLKPSSVSKRVERRDTREAGSAGPALEMIGPEHVGRARLRGLLGHLRIADDLRGVLEGHAIVETHEDRFEKPGSGLGPRQIEGLEDLVGRNHARLESLATMSRIRKRASSENQKSRKGS